jgi:hypothetical protein
MGKCKYCGADCGENPFCIDGGKTLKGGKTKSYCYADYKAGAILDAKLGIKTAQLLDMVAYGVAYADWYGSI